MNNKQFELHFEDLVSRMRNMLLKKGNDYAAGDRLDNFKNAGAVCSIKPEITCLNLIAVKVNRMANLITKDALPENESIQDTAIDLACYSVLLNAIINERVPGFIGSLEKADAKRNDVLKNTGEVKNYIKPRDEDFANS